MTEVGSPCIRLMISFFDVDQKCRLSSTKKKKDKMYCNLQLYISHVIAYQTSLGGARAHLHMPNELQITHYNNVAGKKTHSGFQLIPTYSISSFVAR